MKPVTKLIDAELNEEIDRMIKRIKETLGLKISRVKASKLIAYKIKNTVFTFKSDELLKLLGG
jgi:hypothetical protein